MEELIKALTILSKYMKDDYSRNRPMSCEHDVLYICGVNLNEMDASVVKELVDLGFNPGSDYDPNYDWDNFTQEDWENRWPNLTTCFYSYRYGSC